MSEKHVPAVVGEYQIMQAEPASIAEIVKSNLGPGGLSEFDLDRIKVPTGGATSWTLETLAGEVTQKDIEGVIVYHKTTRAYWKDTFEESGGGNPPDCKSNDGLRGDGNPGGDCATCPFNQWGTGRGGEGKACRESHPLFLVSRVGLIPSVIAVPPSSLKNVKKYLARLSSFGKKFNSVVTKLSLKREKSNGGIAYAQIALAVSAELTPEQHARMEAYTAQLMPVLERVSFTHDDYADPATRERRAPGKSRPAQEPPASDPDDAIVVGEAV